MPSGAPRRVFLSHTSDLGKDNEPETFVAAAVRAVLRARHAVMDMAYFAARDTSPAAYCVEMLAQCDVYVGIIGLGYGSPVRDRADMSYTELEYETAGGHGQPRLIFLVRDDSTHQLAVDQPEDLRARQEVFRARLLASDLTAVRVSTPAELELAIYHALVELDPRPVPKHRPTATAEHRRRAVAALYAAERATASITDEYEKALALAGVASGLAIFDPDRARLMLEEAKEVARGIYLNMGHDFRAARIDLQVSVLAEVASVLAVFDPAQGKLVLEDVEAVARGFIGLDTDRDKEWALFRLATTLAVSDPDRAERAARSLTEEDWKAWVLAEVAWGLAVSDPGRAKRLRAEAPEFTTGPEGQRSFAVLKMIAAIEPHRPEFVLPTFDNFGKEAPVLQIAKALVAADPDRAEQIVEDLRNQEWHSSAYARALAQIARVWMRYG